MHDYKRELEAAIEAVHAGLSIARQPALRDLHVHGKGGVDIVTDADIAAEDAIRRVLLLRCPEIPQVGEERGGKRSVDGAPYWLIDPICGTRNYASKLGLYATNLALVVADQVQVAVVGDGANGQIYAAERGQRAFVADAAERPTLHARAGTVLALDLAGKPPFEGSSHAVGRLVATLISDGGYHLRMLGTTLPFAKLASGDMAGLMMIAS
jgi:myo-inositol-1(or 4)-monophosphatase